MPARNATLPALFAVLLTLAGCASANVTSNKAPDFDLTPERVLVVLRPSPTSEVGQAIMDNLASRLPADFSQRGVQAEALVLGALELDDTLVARRAAETQAQVILVLVETSQTRTDDFVTGSTVEAALLLPETDRTVWRARLEAKSGGGIFQGNPVPQYAKVLVEALFKGLADDGILG